MLGSILEKCAALLLVLAVSAPMTFGTVPAVSAEITAESNANTRMNYAGRQRMLTQKVSKEVCFKMIGLKNLGARELVEATVQDFDKAIAMLLSGSEEAGILPPPNRAVRQQLERARGAWQDFKELVTQIEDDPNVDHDTRVKLANMSDHVLKEMHRAVTLYVQ
ncbi:type IV pili methyl-accepting chemotaxis transducer N-terminal domain-containing protein [Roseobacter sp. A03A-229]